ncbi:MAG: GDSL-type esterase/lipase family protein [Geminicoccaceae bacterium]
MKLLVTILCLMPALALADYPDPKRKQDQVIEFTHHLDETPGQVVITGSSSIRRWRSIHDDLAPAKVISTGIPGTNMNDLDHYLDELVLRFRPSVVVIYQGDNDTMIDKVSVQQVADKFDDVMTRIKEALPDISIYVMSVKPSVKNWPKWTKAVEINKRFAARANELDYLHYIDVANPMLGEDGKPRKDIFAEDGVHLSDKGYRIWTSVLQPILAAHP